MIDFNNDIVNSLKKNTKGISIHTKKNNVIEIIPESEELGFVGKPNKIDKFNNYNILEKKKSLLSLLWA